jgi:hypothetical protein
MMLFELENVRKPNFSPNDSLGVSVFIAYPLYFYIVISVENGEAEGSAALPHGAF